MVGDQDTRGGGLAVSGRHGHPVYKVRHMTIQIIYFISGLPWWLSGREYDKAVYCLSAFSTSMQSTSCEMPGWMKHELESRLPGEISITSDMQMTPPLWQKAKRNERAS